MPPHGDNVRFGRWSEPILITVVVFHHDCFLLPFPYEFHCTLIDKVLATLKGVPTYSFYSRNAQAIKVIGKISDSLSLNTCERTCTREMNKVEDDTQIVEVLVTTTVKTASVDNHLAVNICTFAVNDHHHEKLSAIIEQINCPDISLCDVS